MCVTVGNGDRMDCPSMFPDMAVVIGSENFVMDCYAMPLGGHDVILGAAITGHFGLGPILWVFTEQTLCLCQGDAASYGLGSIEIQQPTLTHCWLNQAT
jgi:hypothetical protein